MEKRIIPYRKGETKNYKSKDRVKIIYKSKGIVALYYYYRYLLGYHKKNNISHKLTEEMRKDTAKMDHYSEFVRFLCKYKLELAENVDDLKDKKLREK